MPQLMSQPPPFRPHICKPHLIEGLEFDLFWWQCLISEGSLDCIQIMGTYGNQAALPVETHIDRTHHAVHQLILKLYH